MAQADVEYSELRLGDQRKQLDGLLNYRDECARGLRSASTGLTIAQQREYELLLQHLDKVVQAQQQRLQSSQHDYEKCSARLRDVQHHNQEIDLLVRQERKLHEELHKHEAQPDHAKKHESSAHKARVRVDEPEDIVPGKPLKPSYR
jgi:flagellar biosynthesis chaperone FliJ